MNDIFISYSRHDRDIAAQFTAAFENLGWSVFWDRDVPPGQNWQSYIGAALEQAKCVIVAWSAASRKSQWVAEEAEFAKRRGLLVPVLIESVDPPIGFQSIQSADLVDWDGDAASDSFRRLTKHVATLLDAPLPQIDEAERRPDIRKRESNAQGSAPSSEKASAMNVVWVGAAMVVSVLLIVAIVAFRNGSAGSGAAVFLRYILILLIGSAIVAVLVRVTQFVLRLRGRNLMYGLATAIHRSGVAIGRTPIKGAAAILNAAKVSLNVRKDSLGILLTQIAGPSVSSLKREDLMELLRRNYPLPEEEIARLDREYAKVLDDHLHKRYASVLRIMTVCWAMVIAVAFQLSTFQLLQGMFIDTPTRIQLVQSGEEPGASTDAPGAASLPSQTLELWPYGMAFFMDRETASLNWNNTLGVLVTAIFLTFGAGAIHNVPNLITRSRPGH